MGNSERWKDRVELSLDGRQVFFLFFGSAVVACLLFVSGVLVGRRIEQHAAAPLAGDDPLAALDQLDSTDADDGLTFHDTLIHPDKRAPAKPAKKPDAAPKKPDAAPAKPEPAAAHPSGHFTLQLSSFAGRAEADELVEQLRAAGMNAQVVESAVPGKGTFFRVRSGDYATRQAATDAKADYEKAHPGGALVAPL